MDAERRSRGWCWLAASLLAAPGVTVAAAADDDGLALIAAVRAQDVQSSRALVQSRRDW